MGDKIIMSKKELERKSLLEGYRYKKHSLKEVAKKMEVSYRQAKRIWKRYELNKDLGLIHQGRGRRPGNAYSKGFKEKILKLYQNKYMGFGPTYACEKFLEDDGIKMKAETLRLWLSKEKLWTKKRKRKVHRELRPRRECFGDLLQIDGSIHAWFEGIEENYCLLNMVDDATGICLALLDQGETTHILLTVFRKWIEHYGIPKAVYVDLKSVYVSPKKLKEKYDDDLLIQGEFSVFQEVCKKLNVEIIRAYSAQAKGRVERKHGIFQDRFVKDLRLYHITTIEGANRYLEEKFLNKINTKFARPLQEIQDTHRSPELYGDLNQIFCWNYQRKLRNDWTIQFKREYYQIAFDPILKPDLFITLRKHLNGKMSFWHEDQQLEYTKLSYKPTPPSKTKRYYQLKGGQDPLVRSHISRKNRHLTPWSRFSLGTSSKPRLEN